MKPRVGHIQFLNSLPLYYCLVHNQMVFNIDLFKDNPRALCRRLLADGLDISPVPAIEYARYAAVRHPKNVRKVIHAFHHSMEMSKKHVDHIAEEAARWDVFSTEFLATNVRRDSL